MMASFQSLPVELKQMIAGMVAKDYEYTDRTGPNPLGTLSLLSHGFKDAARSIKTKHIVSKPPSQAELRAWPKVLFEVHRTVEYTYWRDKDDILKLMDDIRHQKYGPRVSILVDLVFQDHAADDQDEDQDVNAITEILEKAYLIHRNIRRIWLAHIDFDDPRIRESGLKHAFDTLVKHVSVVGLQDVANPDTEHMAGVVRLNLGNCRSLHNLERLTGLKHLTIRNCADVNDVSVFAAAPHLKTFTCDVRTDAERIGQLSGFESLVHVKKLTLLNMTRNTFAAIPEGVFTMPRLRHFEYVNIDINDVNRLKDLGIETKNLQSK